MREIIIRFPKFKRPSRKTCLMAGAFLVVVATAGLYFFWPDQQGQKGKGAVEAGGVQSLQDYRASETPQYTMLLPAGKTIEELGGFQRVSPSDKEAVFAFADNPGGVAITVSQQPLPEAFKGNAGELAKLAEQFGASEKISANGTTVYIGIAKSGQQSVIFAKNELLVLIKSASKIDKANWVVYINSLK